jgi:flagellin
MHGLSIQTNSGAARANLHTRRTSGEMSKSINRLSSGLRVRTAADDSAGLAVSENMRAQSRSITKAARNANDAVALMNVTESGYQSIGDLMVRMRELAVEAANGSISDTERGMLDQEFQSLITETDRVSSVAEYNGIQLMDGNVTNLTFQIGFRNSNDDQLTVTLNAQSANGLGIDAEAVSTQVAAQDAIASLDLAMESLLSDRADIGATINNLNSSISHLSTTATSYGEALGNVRDADIGAESTEFAKHQVMQQAGIAMIAQSNAMAQNALKLISG